MAVVAAELLPGTNITSDNARKTEYRLNKSVTYIVLNLTNVVIR